MKRPKKILALLLVLVLSLTMALPAAAAGPYAITIQNDRPGHTYEAYQIFAGAVSSGEEQGGNVSGPILTQITWGDGVQGDALRAALQEADGEKYGACQTAADVADVLGAEAFTAADMDTFVQVAAQHLTTVHTDSAGHTGTAYVIENLAAGYYLIKDKEGSLEGEGDTATGYIVQVLGNVSMEPKDSEIPTVEKKVWEDSKTGSNSGFGDAYYEAADHSIGDVIPFKLIGSIPDMSGYETYAYTFHDTQSAGLSLTEDPFTVYLVNDLNAGLQEQTVVPDTLYTVNRTPGNGETFTVSFADLKSISNIEDYAYVVVAYTATLNENAKIGSTEGNPNQVYLEFSNNPNGEGTGETTPQHAIVFAYSLNALKEDADDTSIRLQDAKFVLLDENKQNVAVIRYQGTSRYGTGVFLRWTALPQNYASMSLTEWETWEAEQNFGEQEGVLLTSSPGNGAFGVQGLDEGTYQLFEVEAPAGYNKLTEAVTIVIDSNLNFIDFTGTNAADILGSDGSLTVTINGSAGHCEFPAQGVVNVEVLNASGSTLPETGGMGTTLLYGIGGILAAGAGILLVIRRRIHS